MKDKKLIITLIVGIFLISSLLIIFSPTNPRYQPNQNDSSNSLQKLDDDNARPKSSKISVPIHIDNNWSQAFSQGICSGEGTYSKPYVIRDLEIDGGQSVSCILIENSNAYFTIENCVLNEGGFGTYNNYEGGIKLNNVTKGNILNNTCIDNVFYGISMKDCNNITLMSNYIVDNGDHGIYIIDSYNITLNNNTIFDNFEDAIHLENCNATRIENNYIYDNGYNLGYIGEVLRGYEIFTNAIYCEGQNNIIFNNTIIDNEVLLKNSYNISFIENDFKNSRIKLEGIIEEFSTFKIDITNKINTYPIYYYINETNLGFYNFTHAGNPGQLLLVNCNHSLISNLNMSQNLGGFMLYYCNHNSLVENNISNQSKEIYFYGSNNNSIIENILYNNTNGISFDYYCTNNRVINNTIEVNIDGLRFSKQSNCNNITGNKINNNTYYGIFVEECIENRIKNNTINHNGLLGIFLKDCSDHIILNNNFTNCGIKVEGEVEKLRSISIDTSNTVNEKAIYYYLDECSLNEENFTGAGQIILVNCNDSLIKDLTIHSASYGILLYYCDNVSVINNDLRYHSIGLYFYESNNLNITDNTAKYNLYQGFYFEDCNNGTLINNKINQNEYQGMQLFYCRNYSLSFNTIDYNDFRGAYIIECLNISFFENNVRYNDDGLVLSNSNHSYIYSNLISENENNGISLYRSFNNDIRGNDIFYNGHGFSYYVQWDYTYYYEGDGIYLTGSNYNTITENRFLGNYNNIRERNCQGNIIYNNYYLDLIGGGNGDDDDKSREYDQIFIILLVIIISSMIVAVGIPLYYYHNREKRSKSIHKKRFQESDEILSSTRTSKEILMKLANKELLLQIFQTKEAKETISQLERIDLTAISYKFLSKLDSIQVDDKEKQEFLKEMLLFSPEERNEILDKIMKRLNSYSEGE